MSESEALLREARLQECLGVLQNEVRARPDDAKKRIFLFQLLAVLGQWDRANNQLTVAGELDDGALAMVQTYREALRCEVLRAEVFAGKRTPLVFGDPQEWVALLIQAAHCVAGENFAEAKNLYAKALDEAPATSGSIDGKPFEWLADAETRLGPVLEAIINGRYYWVPLHRIQTLEIEEPTDLRDMVWLPAHFVFANGGESVGLIPSRYPLIGASEDDETLLGRKTLWNEITEGVYLGSGQKVLATESGDFPLLEIRKIELDVELQADTAEQKVS